MAELLVMLVFAVETLQHGRLNLLDQLNARKKLAQSDPTIAAPCEVEVNGISILVSFSSPQAKYNWPVKLVLPQLHSCHLEQPLGSSIRILVPAQPPPWIQDACTVSSLKML